MVTDLVLVAAVAGGIAAGAGVLVVAFLLPRTSCPACKTLLPRFRTPGNAREAMLGGWHCPACGAKIARNGTLLSGATDDRRV